MNAEKFFELNKLFCECLAAYGPGSHEVLNVMQILKQWDDRLQPKGKFGPISNALQSALIKGERCRRKKLQERIEDAWNDLHPEEK